MIEPAQRGTADVHSKEGLRLLVPERTFAQDVTLAADPDHIQIVRPPSTGNSAPVMKPASSEAR